MGKKIILLTGAAGSLGSALAAQCADEAWATVLLDRDLQGLERVSDAIEGRGLEPPVLHPLDLSSMGPDDVQEMLDAIAGQYGGLDALVHCAARFEALTPLEHIQPQEWLHSVQVNLNAAWLITAMCLPLLRNAAAGKVYFMLEDLPEVGGPLWGAYGVCKHALHAMVGQLAAECAGSSLQILGINPGPMQSPLRSRAYIEENPSTPAEPARAAKAVMDLLADRLLPSGVYADFGGG